MIFDDVMTELHERYPEGVSQQQHNSNRLTVTDVQRWSQATGHLTSGLYDQIAVRLAYGFHTGELTFDFCDAVVNAIHAIITLQGEERPDLFWRVFLAFDSGEFYHDGNRDQDPVETYTRPEIALIVASLDAHPPLRDAGDGFAFEHRQVPRQPIKMLAENPLCYGTLSPHLPGR